MPNIVYKAILDFSPSSNPSWDLMKEILLCKVNFRNELINFHETYYLNDYLCGRNCVRKILDLQSYSPE